MSTTTTTRALVVANNQALRKVVCTALRRDAYEVLEATNGLDALSILSRRCIDIALVDVRLPELDGLDLVRRVRRDSTVPIILMTARSDKACRVAGLEVGADAYVVKPFSMAEVTALMRAQLRRAHSFRTDEALLRVGPVELDLGTRRCTMDGHAVNLTRREFDLLYALMRNPGRIHTREQLLELVWGTHPITSNTVDVRVASLRRKLGTAITIATLRGVGYRLDSA
jgi:DNA-binding response OmpR family regulator